jgi:hypothetical protein
MRGFEKPSSHRGAESILGTSHILSAPCADFAVLHDNVLYHSLSHEMASPREDGNAIVAEGWARGRQSKSRPGLAFSNTRRLERSRVRVRLSRRLRLPR